jgi:hypothetical protein
MLLSTLSARTDLKAQQHDLIASSLLGVAEKLRESASAGDERAREFQKIHQSSK